jgi:hypothetical protein
MWRYNTVLGELPRIHLEPKVDYKSEGCLRATPRANHFHHRKVLQKEAPFWACIPYMWNASAVPQGVGIDIMTRAGWNY